MTKSRSRLRVKPDMIALTRNDLEIFRAVVRCITVDVVNHFFRFKEASEFLFGYKPVFVNTTTLVRVWMLWNEHADVISLTLASAFPCTALLTSTTVMTVDKPKRFSFYVAIACICFSCKSRPLSATALTQTSHSSA